jgi:hypothetical protein
VSRELVEQPHAERISFDKLRANGFINGFFTSQKGKAVRITGNAR